MSDASPFNVWDWIKTERLSGLRLGQPQRDVMFELGPPDQWYFSRDYPLPGIMRYGSLELIFDSEGNCPLLAVTYEPSRLYIGTTEVLGFKKTIYPIPAKGSAKFRASNFPDEFLDVDLIAECRKRGIKIERKNWKDLLIFYGLGESFLAAFDIDDDGGRPFFGQLTWVELANDRAYLEATPEPLPEV